MLQWLIGIILGEIICKSSNWQHIQRLKITILGANWLLFRLEIIAKCSYVILSTQNIKFYWFVTLKIKIFLLPIWWCNRGSFPLGNKYFAQNSGVVSWNRHFFFLSSKFLGQFSRHRVGVTVVHVHHQPLWQESKQQKKTKKKKIFGSKGGGGGGFFFFFFSTCLDVK